MGASFSKSASESKWNYVFPADVYMNEEKAKNVSEQKTAFLKAFPAIRVYNDVTQASPEAKGKEAEFYRTAAALVACDMAYNADYHKYLEEKKDQGKINMINNLMENMDKEKKHARLAMAVMLLHDIGKVGPLLKEAGFEDDRVSLHDLRMPAILTNVLTEKSSWGQREKEIYHSLPLEFLPAIKEMWQIGFDLAQFGQGEAPVEMVDQLRRYYIKIQKDAEKVAQLKIYLFHAVFDVAGALNNEEKGVMPTLFIPPVVNRFVDYIRIILEGLSQGKTSEQIYADAMISQVKDEKSLAALKEMKLEEQLPVLRILAMNRFLVVDEKYVKAVQAAVQADDAKLTKHLGKNGKVLLYYSPVKVQSMLKDKPDPSAVAPEIVSYLIKSFEKADQEGWIQYNLQDDKDFIKQGEDVTTAEKK
eukprot:g38544.t1